MATKNLKALMKKSTELTAKMKGEEDLQAARDSQALQEATSVAPTASVETVSPAPVAVAPVEFKQAFVAKAESILKNAPAVGVLDTVEGVDPASFKIQATTRMPGGTHKAATFKLDLRLIQILDEVSRKQNIAALVSHLLVRGLAEVLRDVKTTSTPNNYHVSYETPDRNTFCGVTDQDLLALVAYVEKNKTA